MWLWTMALLTFLTSRDVCRTNWKTCGTRMAHSVWQHSRTKGWKGGSWDLRAVMVLSGTSRQVGDERMLLTTRHSCYVGMTILGNITPVVVDKLSMACGSGHDVCGHIPNELMTESEKATKQLVGGKFFDGLPVTISIARHVIVDSGMTVQEYLHLFKRVKNRGRGKHESPEQHQRITQIRAPGFSFSACPKCGSIRSRIRSGILDHSPTESTGSSDEMNASNIRSGSAYGECLQDALENERALRKMVISHPLAHRFRHKWLDEDRDSWCLAGSWPKKQKRQSFLLCWNLALLMMRFKILAA